MAAPTGGVPQARTGLYRYVQELAGPRQPVSAFPIELPRETINKMGMGSTDDAPAQLAADYSKLEVLCVVAPCDWIKPAGDALFSSIFKWYVHRAFGEDLETDETCDSMLEHRTHTVGGSFLLVAGIPLNDDLNGDALAEASRSCEGVLREGAGEKVTTRYRMVGHASFIVDLDSHFRDDPVVWNLDGICTDPRLHGSGVGSAILSSGMAPDFGVVRSAIRHALVNVFRSELFAPPMAIAARTQSLPVLRMLVKVWRECIGHNKQDPPFLFPVAVPEGVNVPPGGDEAGWTLLAERTCQRYWLADSTTYSSERGVFVKVYAPDRVAAFGGDQKTIEDEKPAEKSSGAVVPAEDVKPIVAAPRVNPADLLDKDGLTAAVEARISRKEGDAFLVMIPMWVPRD